MKLKPKAKGQSILLNQVYSYRLIHLCSSYLESHRWRACCSNCFRNLCGNVLSRHIILISSCISFADVLSQLSHRGNLIKESITHHTHSNGCSVDLTVLTQPYYSIFQTTRTQPVKKTSNFPSSSKRLSWGIWMWEYLVVGWEGQTYSCIVSVVPSGGGVCLIKCLKVKQECVSRGAKPLLCYDHKEQTCITPKHAFNNSYVIANSVWWQRDMLLWYHGLIIWLGTDSSKISTCDHK